MRQKTIHAGRNVKRFREMLGMKQEALADKIGSDWNQKKISQLEAKEHIDPAILEMVAKALKVAPDAIKNFDEENAVALISNTVIDNAGDQLFVIKVLGKWIDTLEENKKLYAALLKEKNEKIALLEELLAK